MTQKHKANQISSFSFNQDIEGVIGGHVQQAAKEVPSLLYKDEKKVVALARTKALDLTTSKNIHKHKRKRKKIQKLGKNIFAHVANLIMAPNYKKMKTKAKIQRSLQTGHNLQRGKSFGVNNYLGYVAFFAQRKSKRVKKKKKSKNKDFYFDLSNENMRKYKSNKNYYFQLTVQNINGKDRLVGKRVGGKHTNDEDSMIVLGAQKSEEAAGEDTKGSLNNSLSPLVGFINSKNIGWSASLYPRFKGKSIKELAALYPKHQIAASSNKTPSLFFREKMFAQRTSRIRAPSLVTSLNLIDYMPPPLDQKKCMCSYAVAAIGSIEARLNFKHKHNYRLSIQDIINCNYYSQGCEGGNPFEVMRYLKDFNAIPEKCSPFKGKQEKCESKGNYLQLISYKVTLDDYGYVGGHYGGSNERNIMKEVQARGPVTASFQPTVDFHFYRSGIFQPMVKTSWQGFGFTFRRQWWMVSQHCIIYGWGLSTNGVKFWRVRNTWGKSWGTNGDFKVIRGVNAMGIERSAIYGIPSVERPARN